MSSREHNKSTLSVHQADQCNPQINLTCIHLWG